MVAIFQLVLVVRVIFAVLVRSLPLLPIPLVLETERWLVSNYVFSRLEVVVLRVSYLMFLLISVYLTYVLALICWDW